MSPTSPVLPTDKCGLEERVFAKDQPEYLPLPAVVVDNVTTTRWRLTWRERLRVLWTGDLWLQQMNFGRALQPQLPQVHEPKYQFAETQEPT